MTQTSDPAAAALAVQLAALKGTLGQAREDLETAIRELATRIDQVASDLAAMAARDPKGPPAACWPALDADARTDALAVLTEWVAVMRQWHPSYFEPVADCWAAHPEVVIELHNIMTEFTRVYRMTHPPLGDTLLLYERWLPGMLRRCHDVMKTCGPAGCSRGRQLMYKAYYRGEPECIRQRRQHAQALLDCRPGPQRRCFPSDLVPAASGFPHRHVHDRTSRRATPVRTRRANGPPRPTAQRASRHEGGEHDEQNTPAIP